MKLGKALLFSLAVTIMSCEQISPVSSINKEDVTNSSESSRAIPGFKKYDTGTNTDVAIHGAAIVEVHNGQASSTKNNLYYRVGRMSGPDIQWGSSYKYTTGRNPSIAMSNYGCVEVHKGSNDNRNYYYKVGTYHSVPKNVTWGASHKYTTGDEHLSVAIEGSTVVEAHIGSGGIYYKVGTVNWNNKTIQWGPSVKMGISTDRNSDVSIDISGSQVILAYTVSRDPILITGTVRVSNKTILWNNPRKIAHDNVNAEDISIALEGNRFVVEVLDGKLGDSNNIYRFDGTTDNFPYYHEAVQYSTGQAPAVAIFGRFLVETHPGTSNGNLYYRFSLL